MPTVLTVVYISCGWPTEERAAARPRPLERVSGERVLVHRVATINVCGFHSGWEGKGKGCTKASKDGEACRENHHDEMGFALMNGEGTQIDDKGVCDRRRRLETMRMRWEQK